MTSATVLPAAMSTLYVLCLAGVMVMVRVTDISVIILIAVSLLVSSSENFDAAAFLCLFIYHPNDVIATL